MDLEAREQQQLWLNWITLFPERCLCFAFALFVLGILALMPHPSIVAAAGSGSDKGDATRGRKVFENRCTGCHSLDQDKEGPKLRGAFGRKAGSIATFKYSAAMKASDITWDADSLDQWLADPEKIVPDSDMAFRVPKVQERTDVIAYLEQLSK
jgi:cytochrome c